MIDAERRGEQPYAQIGDDDDVAVAAITVAELLVGVSLASGTWRTTRQRFVDAVLESVPVLPYDTRVARTHATLLVAVRRSGRPRGAHDLIIAATAASSGRTVLTEDSTAFDDLPGVQVQAH